MERLLTRKPGLLTDNPTEFVKITKQDAPRAKRLFTMGEIQAAMTAADKEWQSMILFGLYTGQRLGDIASLTWENIDLNK